MILTDNINDVKKYYGRKYRKILNALENKKASNYKIDDSCGTYLQLECNMKDYHLIFNIGIDDKYHMWETFGRFGETKRYDINGQEGIVLLLNTIKEVY